MPDQLFEFEVHLSTNNDLKAGVLATTITKVVAAGPDWWTAHKTAMDLAWRGDRMVTAGYTVL